MSFVSKLKQISFLYRPPVNSVHWNDSQLNCVCTNPSFRTSLKTEQFDQSLLASVFCSGECWSGPETGDTYNRAGTVDTCKTLDYKQCDPSDSTECVGEQKTNFVYGVELPGSLLIFFIKSSKVERQR